MTGHLSRVAIVLDHPKDVVNIGGVIRVMKNFGLSDLRLVNPDEFDAYRLEGIAHRTRDVIDAATTFESLEDAIADATFVVGTTARTRPAGRPYSTGSFNQSLSIYSRSSINDCTRCGMGIVYAYR